MKKLLIATALAVTMVGALFATAEAEDSSADAGPTPLSVMMTYGPVAEDADFSNYFWTRFMEQKFNVELEFNTFPANVARERANIAFAAGDLSDLIFGGALEAIVSDAIKTGQLLQLSERLANGTGWVNHPFWDEIRPVITYFDGEIYTVARGTFGPTPQNAAGRYFINKPWAEAVGTEWPIETLDELTETLYAMKADKPELYPVSGIWDIRRVTGYFELAHGIKTHAFATGLAYRLNVIDDEVVLSPVHPNFKAYLEYTHQLYKDGIIDPEYFTQQRAQLTSRAAEHGFGLVSDGAGHTLVGVTPESFNYHHAPPLLSDYNDELWWPKTTALSPNHMGIYAFTEHPDKAFEILDWHGTIQQSAISDGLVHPDWVEGMDIDALVPTGAARENVISEVNSDGTLQTTVIPEGFTNWTYWNIYLYPHTSATPRMQMSPEVNPEWWASLRGEWVRDAQNPGDWFHMNMAETIADHYVRVFSAKDVSFTESEQEVVDTYQGELEAYVDEMHAKFIMGIEPISEYEAFVANLDRYGLQEVTEAYQAAYERWAAVQ